MYRMHVKLDNLLGKEFREWGRNENREERREQKRREKENLTNVSSL